MRIVQKTTNGIEKCHARGPTKLVDNGTTRKDSNENQITNINYQQNS